MGVQLLGRVAELDDGVLRALGEALFKRRECLFDPGERITQDVVGLRELRLALVVASAVFALTASRSRFLVASSTRICLAALLVAAVAFWAPMTPRPTIV